MGKRSGTRIIDKVRDGGWRKLEWKQTWVVIMLLVTLVAMSGYIDWLNTAAHGADGAGGETASPVSGSSAWDGGASSGGNAAGQGGGRAVAASIAAEKNHEGIIRLHVIANSDSEADQELKLKVRNNVLAKVQNHLADLISREMGAQNGSDHIKSIGDLESDRRAELTRSYINENLDQIEGWAEDVIQAEGFTYDVEASLGVTWIPAKDYDGLFFPAGNYEALNIVIGEGAGQNWWCVIFPPLCLIDGSGSGASAGLSEEEDSLAEVDGFPLDAEDGSRIILKSKIRELLAWWQSGEDEDGEGAGNAGAAEPEGSLYAAGQ